MAQGSGLRAKLRQYGALGLVFVLAAVLLVAACIIINDWQSRRGKVPTETFDLPYIYIKTQNSLPTSLTDYANCSFEITNTEDEADAFSVSMKKKYGAKDSVGIRLRGNSTPYGDKKPYRLKFDQPQSFFGSTPNRSWSLLADYVDPALMRNYAGFELSALFENLAYTPWHRHVILYLNGKYQGVYLLTDVVDESPGRTAVATDFDAATDTDFPFLVEMSQDNTIGTGTYDVDFFTIDGFEPIEIKYPTVKERDPNGVVYKYIYDYMNAVLTLLKNGNQAVKVSFRSEPVTLGDLVDEASLMDYYLVNEIIGNWDASQKSIKIHKTKNGKLTFGPVWDFDTCAIPKWTGQPDEVSTDLSLADRRNVVGSPVPSKWLAIGDNRIKFYNRFMEKRDCIFDLVEKMQDYYAYIAPAARANANYWYGKNGEVKFEEQYQFLQDYLLLRYTKLESILLNL